MTTRILIVIFGLAVLPFMTGCNSNAKKSADTETKEVKEESKADKDDGWITLFDGKTSDGWRGFKMDHFPSGWQIVDGSLQCIGSGRGEAGSKEGGDIIYDKELSKFEKRDIESKMEKRYFDRFQIPLGIALLFLAIEACITTRRGSSKSGRGGTEGPHIGARQETGRPVGPDRRGGERRGRRRQKPEGQDAGKGVRGVPGGARGRKWPR